MIEAIACLGLMWILKYGSILQTPRYFLMDRIDFFDTLFSCSLCLGFWCGVLVGSFCFYFCEQNNIYILYPFVSSAVCWFFDMLLDSITSSKD